MTAETIVETYLPVRVGRSGTKVHDLHASIRWNERKGRVSVYTGQTNCGSQRFGSGWSAVDPATPLTCLKCADRRPLNVDSTQSYGDRTYERHANPTEVITTQGWGRTLVPTPEVVERLTPDPNEQCRDRDFIPGALHPYVRCSRTTHLDDQHVYDGQEEDR